MKKLDAFGLAAEITFDEDSVSQDDSSDGEVAEDNNALERAQIHQPAAAVVLV